MLGFVPSTGLEEGLETQVEWCRKLLAEEPG